MIVLKPKTIENDKFHDLSKWNGKYFRPTRYWSCIKGLSLFHYVIFIRKFIIFFMIRLMGDIMTTLTALVPIHKNKSWENSSTFCSEVPIWATSIWMFTCHCQGYLVMQNGCHSLIHCTWFVSSNFIVLQFNVLPRFAWVQLSLSLIVKFKFTIQCAISIQMFV